MRHTFLLFALLALFLDFKPLPARAQRGPVPNPSPPTEQDEVKVFTEEVRIPLFAYDEHGRFDPSLEMRDIMVLEDDVHQEIKSLRRLPASILLVLNTGGEMNTAMRSSTTRDIALNLVENIKTGDQISVLQFAARAEVLQRWTTEKNSIVRVLNTKLSSGRGSRLAGALTLAATQLHDQPIGNRHVVLVTDGVDMPPRAGYKEAMSVLNSPESPKDKAAMLEAVRQLNAAQATVHVISYTTAGSWSDRKGGSREKYPATPPGSVAASDIRRAGIDPTSPPGMNRGGASTSGSPIAVITFDPQMRKLRKAYESATKRGEQQLASLAEEMGGRIWLPTSLDEMISYGGEVAREIGSQYVMTYAPKRPLANSPVTEYRRIKVVPRRAGLQLRARRGYTVAAMR
ncbi:MAG TPA: VWA domain-containing protein [Pyrinomonadaceae bacterium]|jgi:VWFA-related protein|nr:VWA domain-containing protein [Pyrinomonadaceae bacterium]